MKRPVFSPKHTIQVKEFKKVTPKAVLIVTLAGKEVWLPKSKIELGVDRVTIPEWLKKEKGL